LLIYYGTTESSRSSRATSWFSTLLSYDSIASFTFSDVPRTSSRSELNENSLADVSSISGTSSFEDSDSDSGGVWYGSYCGLAAII
jgi:hypothetical protein